MKHFNPRDYSHGDNYRLAASLVVPRPIAWVSTLGRDGIINLAPYSFFNIVSSDPLYVLISVGQREDGSPKDTARNILETGEFVVNLVTEDLIRAMNISATDFPANESELAAAGLHAAPSQCLGAPVVAEARASLECRLHSSQPLGNSTLLIGEVVMMNVADEFLAAGLDVPGFTPVGRMGSPAWYCRTGDRFEMSRVPYSALKPNR
ncbi:flavin reductase (DIM6/NTAB) family NADH-FMN oxidoreductase RutF [Fluviicoccus keumensis]|uniref:Flavin reductase (DIM6/NTAB) family NADH-FMN oxidoreductase RutF n=1 Tax=Fluviicoccus keumensis TaxID=1435465 RepID=A0A4Q7YN13_9GAMM|nr:flavin reductase family protein [Fluviicoccus keumensis]RZU38201.1 flavin reductase (DIM6/NTAB) family NADH-FMN oxidoreductase RutF [Fluviicoccus keumensis]